MCLHHYREAIRAYEHGAAIEPNNLVCTYNIGYALSRLGDGHAADYFLKAIGAWEQMENSSPTRRSLANQYSAMSHAYMGVGRPQEAVAALEKALAITKTVRPARLFSSTKYVLVSNSEFVAEIRKLLVKARGAVQRKHEPQIETVRMEEEKARMEEARIAAEAAAKIREERKDNDDTKKAAKS